MISALFIVKMVFFHSQIFGKDTNNDIFLSKNIIPTSYSLEIRPNMKDFTFKGNVKINILALSDEKNIRFHSKNLKITNLIMDNTEINDFELDEEKEELIITNNIEAGGKEIKIEFEGEIENQRRGFFRSSYKDDNGNVHYVAMTHLEPTYARRIFPCFDQPNLKATFDLKLIVDEEFDALGNTSVKTIEKENNVKTIIFEKTPIMSTYLLAFFVGNYGNKSIITENGIKVSVYAPKEKLTKVDLALSTAKFALEFLKNYTKIKYHLKEYKMITAPDFSAGAMENWGLVVFKDIFLYNDKSSSVLHKELVEEVVIHEVAHQWFGNLVTMDWWSELWLNEGFATFFESIVSKKMPNSNNTWLKFVSQITMSALKKDSFPHSRKLESVVDKKEKISQMFDEITYKKAASLLNMVRNYIGNNAFKNSISAYLSEIKYGNANSDDLWKTIGKVSKRDISSFIKTFINQPGFPIIKIYLLKSEKNVYSFRLKQTKFQYPDLNDHNEKDTEKYKWKIPLEYDVNGSKFMFLMESVVLDIDIEIINFKYIHFNYSGQSYVRTLHSKRLFNALINQVKEENIKQNNRFAIFEEAYTAFLINKMDSKTFLDTLLIFRKENSLIVWDSILKALNYIRTFLSTENDHFDRFVVYLLSPLRSKLGTDFSENKDDNNETIKMRAKLVFNLALFNDEVTLNYLKEKFEELDKNGDKDIDPNLFPILLYFSGKYGIKDFDLKITKFIKNSNDSNKITIAYHSYLSVTNDNDLALNILEKILTEPLNANNALALFESAMNNYKIVDTVWNFFKKNYDTIKEKYNNIESFSRFVVIVKYLNTEKNLNDAEKFFELKDSIEYDAILISELQKARLKINLKKREYFGITDWLFKHKSKFQE